MKGGAGRLLRGARLAAGREVSGMACVLRTPILPSMGCVLRATILPSLRCDFVRGNLILSVRYLAQRHTTSSAPRGERHGLSVTYHHPTELVCCFCPGLPSSLCMHLDFVSGKLILSVRYLMRSVTVPTSEDWGQAPRMQVTLSGVFATKEEAEKAAQT